MYHRLRWLLAPALAALVLIPFAAATRAEDGSELATTAQTPNLRNATSCDRLQPQITRGGFTAPVLIMSDANLIEGSHGNRLCLFWDQLGDAYSL